MLGNSGVAVARECIRARSTRPDGALSPVPSVMPTAVSAIAAGAPERERFGLTVTPGRDQVWLDDPGHVIARG